MVTAAKVLRKWKLFEGDKVIWMILFFLGLVSIIEVYSASSNMSYKTGYYWKPILQHGSYFVIGVIATLLIHKIPCRYFKLIPLLGIPVSVVFLVVAMFTEKVNNASRWLEVAGVGFQPSELAKGVLITTVAMILASMRDEKGAQWRAFKWIMIMAVLICGLIVPENFSTAAMTFLVVLIMMFVGGVPWKQLGSLLGGLTVAGAALFVFLAYAPSSTLKTVGELPLLHGGKRPRKFRGTRFPSTIVFRFHLCHCDRGTRIGRRRFRDVPLHRVAIPVCAYCQPMRAQFPGFFGHGAFIDVGHPGTYQYGRGRGGLSRDGAAFAFN